MRVGMNYILAADGKTPINEPDVLKWAVWFETADRVVRQDRIGDYLVSTIFIGVDYNFRDEGEPILWETLVVGGLGFKDIRTGRRYSSYDAAVQGHEQILELIRKAALS